MIGLAISGGEQQGVRGIDQRQRSTSPADFAHAKRHGLMFDPFTGTHDRLVAKVKAAAKALDPRDVCDALLASLSTSASSAEGRAQQPRRVVPCGDVEGFGKPRRAPR